MYLKCMIVILTVLIVFPLELLGENDLIGKKIDSVKANSIINIALNYTGFSKYNKIDIEELSKYIAIQPYVDNTTPFLLKDIDSISAYVIDFDNIYMEHLSDVFFTDSISRSFKVYIDAINNKLLKIHYTSPNYSRSSSPLPSSSQIEQRMRNTGEVYLSFPNSHPDVTFIDALKSVLLSPFNANEIIAVYVSESKLNSNPTNVWSIDLRGLDPVPNFSPRTADKIPEYLRNHMRSVIDAKTNKRLFSTSIP